MTVHVLTLCVLLLIGGWVDGQEVKKNRSLDCQCSDVDPRFGKDKHVKFVRGRCWEHLKEGECDRGFMFNTVEELSEGFCQITCGRCDCCRTLRNVAEEEGLTDWLWAMDTVGVKDIDEPGWEVSVLAPRDGSIAEVLTKLGGWSRADVEGDPEKKAVLREVLMFNIISPLPEHWAVFTSPFFTEGVQLKTEFDAFTQLTVREWGEGNIGFQGPVNSGTVSSGTFDKPSCKGYLHVSDQYVLPFEDGSRLTQEASSVGSTPGFCKTAKEKEYGGDMLDTVKADDAGDCCSRCNSNSECNVWSFCARETGCHKGGDAPDVWWGDCQLKFDSGVAEGRDPATVSVGRLVPYHSGHIVRTPGASVEAVAG